MVPETEAPSEFNLFFPDKGALCIAECATHCLHNIITLRGALVRDAKRWSKYLDETIALYGNDTEVLFSSHHWPTWEQAKVEELISEQRDLYGYLHDQTVRLMNQGLNGSEIAEQLQLPTTLQRRWHTQGYYGSISHNVKGIYQRYMTWFDGNPANLWKHPPVEEGKRYVTCMGGIDAVISRAKTFAAEGDLRFAATLLDHAVAAEPVNINARSSLADVYERLGYGAENATWRNFYLTGAASMRKPPANERSRSGKGGRKSLASINPQSNIEDWPDALAVQLDGVEAGKVLSSRLVHIKVPEERRLCALRLSNGTLTHRIRSLEETQSSTTVTWERILLTITSTKAELYELLAHCNTTMIEKTAVGDVKVLRDILGLCGITGEAAASSGEQSRL